MKARGKKRQRRSADWTPARPVPRNEEGTGWPESPTALAAEVLLLGVHPSSAGPPDALPHEGETILAGDPDDDALSNEYVGEETPGGSASTPDQNDVDAIGRVYGVQEQDSGRLRTTSEVLARRDRRRSELQAPGRPESL